MERVSSLLPGALRRRGLSEQAKAALVVHRTAEWLATKRKSAKNDMRPVCVKDGVLTVECTSSIALQEGEGLKHSLFVWLSKEGFSAVTSVRFVRA